MPESIGKALATAIKEPAIAGADSRGRHIFQSQPRRVIFSVLTRMPCIGVSRLADVTGLANNTVKWHVEKLLKAGFVVAHHYGKREIYFPEGLIGHELADLFAAINHSGIGAIYRMAARKPGVSQSDLAAITGESRQAVARAALKLQSLGLIAAVTDGKSIRYYPTRYLADCAEDYYAHSKEFSDYILRRLEGEGGKPPTIVKRGLGRMVVELGYPRERFAVDIGINPFITYAEDAELTK